MNFTWIPHFPPFNSGKKKQSSSVVEFHQMLVQSGGYGYPFCPKKKGKEITNSETGQVEAGVAEDCSTHRFLITARSEVWGTRP